MTVAIRDLIQVYQGEKLDIPGFSPAAVLVPLIEKPDGLEVLLTVRSESMRTHPGQIAFPGGRTDPGETPEQTALRETAEEVGLHVPTTNVLGRLGQHPSPAGFVATPVVAFVDWPQPLTLEEREVQEAFTVPLNELAQLTPTSRVYTDGRYTRRLYSYTWQGRVIWGFTGNVIHELISLIGQTLPEFRE